MMFTCADQLLPHSIQALPSYDTFTKLLHRINDVIVNVLASRAIDRGFESQTGQAKVCQTGICCFPSK